VRVSENVSHLKDVKHLKPPDPVSKAFQRLFTSYAKSINIQENRHGSLFEKPFKRVEISSVNYLCNLVFYIHANPQAHGIVDDFRIYPWSSYDRILKNNPSKLKKEELLEWFEDKDNYVGYHSQKADLALIKELAIDN
jgi:putative transposase